jgi:hypothetical protein
MSLDWGDIRPVPANWFQSSAQYEGTGHATFAGADRVLRGPTVVSFDERGEARAKMTSPVVVSGGQDPNVDVSRFLLSEPTCLRLTVAGEHGTFETDGRVSYDWEDTDLFRSAEDTSSVTMTFRWIRSQLVVGHGGDEQYWVPPLLNLLFDPKQHTPELDRHPLRIYPTPVVPTDADPDRAFFRRAYANQRNQLVICGCFGELGFIERLADYEERKSALESGAERRLITAVMTGQPGGACDTWKAVTAWFPFDVLGLLAMASGAAVGAPWLEFRNGTGALARRWQVRLGAPDYRRGHAAIDEGLHEGMGLLVTRALASKGFGSASLRVALRHLVDGLEYEQPIEERLGHFCRGIDGLSKAYGAAGRDLLKTVGAKYRKSVKQALAEAQEAMRAVAAEATASGDIDEATLLETIAHRTVSNPAYVDHNFGDAAVRLMEHFGLHDPAVMDHFPAAKSTTSVEGPRRWAKWLSDCRGTAMHGGYFDIVGGRHDPELLWQTTQHLLDILLRIILKIVGYDGAYQPAVARFPCAQQVDWVRPDMPPHALGYA